MSEHIQRTIDDLIADIEELDREASSYKETVNRLLAKIGQQARYTIGAASSSMSTGVVRIAPDQFTGKALNSAITTYLQLRKASMPTNAPATAEEIMAALRDHGYTGLKGDSESQLKGLRITLGKSSHTFHKLNNGRYGLSAWYGIKPTSKKKLNGTLGDDPSAASEDGDDASLIEPGDQEVADTKS